MVPHLPNNNGLGRGFKGAALYYLHDKNADTCDRVGATATFNIATDDPDMAWRIMTATAMNQQEIKRAAGTKATGRKLANPVFSYSLSWSPDEQPDPDHMIEQAKRSLAALDLSENQALVVQHTDTTHPHIHILVNRVHPETGIAAKLKYTKQRLDRWAHSYEKKHGIKCLKRQENERKREKARFAREMKIRDIRLRRSWEVSEAVRFIEQQNISDMRNLEQHHIDEKIKLNKQHNRLVTRVIAKFDILGRSKKRQEAEKLTLRRKQQQERLKLTKTAEKQTEERKKAIHTKYERQIEQIRKLTDIQKNVDREKDIQREIRRTREPSPSRSR